jgi:hypothetical protein
VAGTVLAMAVGTASVVTGMVWGVTATASAAVTAEEILVTVRQLYLRVDGIPGSTIQNIVVERHIAIEPQPTGLEVLHAVILWQTAKLEQGNKSADKVGILRVIAAGQLASAIGLVLEGLGTGQVEAAEIA